jgi:anaerobic dimethyl sulfoxide reductase subunit B (iron-sulfur subunit)
MAKQMAFYFDASACNGCKACVIACKSENNLPVGINWRQVYEYMGGSWVQHPERKDIMMPSGLFAYPVSTACMHCANPVCAQVCPSSAIFKREEDGVVLIDLEKCIGCRYCEWACPYGAPQYDESIGKMTKCDFCYDLLDKGEEPFCTASCVMRALEFGELEELRAKYGNVDAIEPLPVAEITEPSVVITPHRDAQPSGQGAGYHDHRRMFMAEPHETIPVETIEEDEG